MQQSDRVKMGLVFLGRKRPGFDRQWGERMEEAVRAGTVNAAFDIWEPAEKVVDNPSLKTALAAAQASNVDVLVALQTTMADARMASTLAQLWPDPIVLWATPENQEGDVVSSCSLVGLHAWASILHHLGRSFELLYCDPRDAEASAELEQAVRVALTVRRLKSARLAVIGGQAPGFMAMSVEPLVVQRNLGTQVQMLTLADFQSVYADVPEADVAADVDRVKDMNLPRRGMTDADLPVSSRIYLAYRQFFDEGFDAVASRCWPELPNQLKQWPYWAMARLADDGFAIACEGDADGALNALIGETLGMGRCYLSDWLEHDADSITLWHGGAAPPSLCCPQGDPGEATLTCHFNNKLPGVVDGTIQPEMPVTICRLWHCDDRYHLMACHAETLTPRRHLQGTNALVRPLQRDPREWFIQLCRRGMPHHVAVFKGHHQALLRRFSATARIEFLE